MSHRWLLGFTPGDVQGTINSAKNPIWVDDLQINNLINCTIYLFLISNAFLNVPIITLLFYGKVFMWPFNLV